MYAVERGPGGFRCALVRTVNSRSVQALVDRGDGLFVEASVRLERIVKPWGAMRWRSS